MAEEVFDLKAVSIERLEPGMTLARTVTNEDMVIVLSEGTVLANAHITRLKSLDIPVVYIKDDFDLSQNYQQASAILKKNKAFAHEFDVVSKYADEVFQSLKEGNIPKEQTQKVAAHILPMADNSGTIISSHSVTRIRLLLFILNALPFCQELLLSGCTLIGKKFGK